MLNYFIIYETNELVWINLDVKACQNTHLSWKDYARGSRSWRHATIGKWWLSHPKELESIYTFTLIDWKKYCVL